MTLSSDEELEGSAPLISRAREIPKDRYNRVYIAFFICGVATLLPWNFIITAVGYFKYKLRNVTLPENNSMAEDKPGDQTQLQILFETYLVISSSIANAVFMVINTIVSNKLGRTVRYTLGSVVLVIVFCIVIAFTQINTDHMQETFFYITLTLGALFSAGSSFAQGSVVGLAGMFPDRYTKAVMEGMAIGGITAAVANILSLYVGSDPVISALLYFLIGLATILIAFVLFMLIPTANFSRFFIRNAETSARTNFLPNNGSNQYAQEVEWPETTESENVPIQQDSMIIEFQPTVLNVLLMVKRQSACLFLTFFVSLSIFPSIMAGISSVSTADNQWTTTYFTPVSVFLLFNVGDYFGRFATGLFGVLGRRFPTAHVVCVLIRFGFIPLALMCNVQPRMHHIFPVLLNQDFWPGLLCLLIGLSNGYLATSCLLMGVGTMNPMAVELAGNIMTMFMVIGISVGCAASYGLMALV